MHPISVRVGHSEVWVIWKLVSMLQQLSESQLYNFEITLVTLTRKSQSFSLKRLKNKQFRFVSWLCTWNMIGVVRESCARIKTGRMWSWALWTARPCGLRTSTRTKTSRSCCSVAPAADLLFRSVSMSTNNYQTIITRFGPHWLAVSIYNSVWSDSHAVKHSIRIKTEFLVLPINRHCCE